MKHAAPTGSNISSGHAAYMNRESNVRVARGMSGRHHVADATVMMLSGWSKNSSNARMLVPRRCTDEASDVAMDGKRTITVAGLNTKIKDTFSLLTGPLSLFSLNLSAASPKRRMSLGSEL